MSTKNLFRALKAQVGNPYQKLILVTLADIANEKNQCWPSHQYLAERAECHRSTVIRHLAELEEKGLITITKQVDQDGLKSPNIYTFVDVAESDIDVAESNKGSSTEQQGVVAERDIILPYNTPIDTPKGICPKSWADWVEHRKEIRKPLTPKSVKQQQALLAEYDYEAQADIINTSIRSGWAGLFPPKRRAALDKGGGDSTRDRTLEQDLSDQSWARQ